VNVGSTSVTASAGLREAVSSNENDIDDSTHVMGLAILNALYTNSALFTALDDTIGTAAMLAPAADDILTVRVLRSAGCATALVTTPDAIVTAHWVYAARPLPLLTVRFIRALAAPLFAVAAENMADPHPLVVGADAASKLNRGNTSWSTSPGDSCVFSANRKSMAEDEDAKGCTIVSTL
jgi:hypothetical protein